MAKLKLVLNIEDWTTDQLRNAVRDLDSETFGDPNAIAAENVKVLDVLGFILSGELGVAYTIEFDKMED